MKEDKKYVWWGLLGIGVAAFFYFLSAKNKTQTIQVPYLVPQSTPTDTSSPTTGTSISEQSNIIGDHQNSVVPNATNPQFLSNISFPLPPRGSGPMSNMPTQNFDISPPPNAASQVQ